jgi:hypothetical protein
LASQGRVELRLSLGALRQNQIKIASNPAVIHVAEIVTTRSPKSGVAVQFVDASDRTSNSAGSPMIQRGEGIIDLDRIAEWCQMGGRKKLVDNLSGLSSMLQLHEEEVSP